jgi:hypothetical protein
VREKEWGRCKIWIKTRRRDVKGLNTKDISVDFNGVYPEHI